MKTLARSPGLLTGGRTDTMALRLLGRFATGLLGIVLAFFALPRLLLSDLAAALAGPGAPRAEVEALRSALGLDQSWIGQLLGAVYRLLAFDLGVSSRTHRGVAGDLIAVLPHSLTLAVVAGGLGLVAGIAAAWLGTARGVARLPAALLGLAGVIPAQGLALAMLLIWLAIAGPGFDAFGLPRPAGVLAPGIALALPVAHLVARAMALELQVLARREHFLLARASGVGLLRAVRQHGLRNALRGPLANVGVQAGVLLASLALAERLFDRPGLGAYLINSLQARDTAGALGAAMALATLYLVADIVLAALRVIADPRLRLE